MSKDATKKTPVEDISFNEQSVYGSGRWCAAVLGKSFNWFQTNRTKLESDGFPKVDLLVGHTQKADVYAWIEKRRKIRNNLQPVERGLENWNRF